MKNLLGFLIAILLLFTQGLEGKHKKKHSEANIVTVDSLPFDAIWGSNRDEIIPHICAFPRDDFQIFSVSECGLFFCDGIDDIIKNQIRHGKHWKSHLGEWIKQYAAPGSVVLDIGAHIGTQTMIMAKAVGHNGLVVVFEPQHKIFRELFWNMSLNGFRNIRFFCCGVGAHEGSIELSPLRFGNEGATPLLGGTGRLVPLLPIDSLRFTNVSLIKISVVGQEDQVLEGARNTIIRNRPVILIEITTPFELPSYVLRIIRTIEGFGYRVYQLQGLDYLALPIDSTSSLAL